MMNNHDFVELQLQEQRNIENEQDKFLDQISDNVGNMKHISLTMNEELDRQNDVLDDLVKESDVTESNLKRAMKQVDSVLEVSENPAGCALIIFLVLVIVGLILFLVYF